MWKRIKQWWQAEGAMAELHGISDRLLKDMGLEREGLRSRVMGKEEAAPSSPCNRPAVGSLQRT